MLGKTSRLRIPFRWQGIPGGIPGYSRFPGNFGSIPGCGGFRGSSVGKRFVQHDAENQGDRRVYRTGENQVLRQKIEHRESEHKGRVADREDFRGDIQPPLLLKPAVKDVLRGFHPAVEGDQGDHGRLLGGITVEKQRPQQVKNQGQGHQADRNLPGNDVFPEGKAVARVRYLVLSHAELAQMHQEVRDGKRHDEITGMLRGAEMRQEHEQQHGLKGRQARRRRVPDHRGPLNVSGLRQKRGRNPIL